MTNGRLTTRQRCHRGADDLAEPVSLEYTLEVTTKIATVVATAGVVPRVIGRPFVSQLLARVAFAQAEVAHGAEKLLDKLCCRRSLPPNW